MPTPGSDDPSHPNARAISGMDHRPDPDDACGRLWSNTENLTVG
jgi:hypothetical protein